VFFTRSFFTAYKELKLSEESNLSLAQLSGVLTNVSALSPEISDTVTKLLNFESTEKTVNRRANYLGIFILTLLVIVHSL